MPHRLALASLAFVVAASLPADARPAAGQDRRPSQTVVKKGRIDRPAPHWSSIAPEIERVGAAPLVGGLPTIPLPGWDSVVGQRCDIVVKRPGGNPTQDMTGSIGHAKSHQSNGGAGRMRVCGGAR